MMTLSSDRSEWLANDAWGRAKAETDIDNKRGASRFTLFTLPILVKVVNTFSSLKILVQLCLLACLP